MSMNRSAPRRGRAPAIGAALLGLLLAALMVYPWPQHQESPIIAGVIPAPLFFWILWTALFVGYVAWVAYRWDPYADMVRRARSAPVDPSSDSGGTESASGGGER